MMLFTIIHIHTKSIYNLDTLQLQDVFCLLPKVAGIGPPTSSPQPQ